MTYDEQEKNLRERYGDLISDAMKKARIDKQQREEEGKIKYGDLIEKGKVTFDKHCDERLALRDSFNDHMLRRNEEERKRNKQNLFRLQERIRKIDQEERDRIDRTNAIIDLIMAEKQD